jgi:hypothetical protein
MFRTKAARGHGGLHSAVSQLIVIILASLLLAGVAAAQHEGLAIYLKRLPR